MKTHIHNRRTRRAVALKGGILALCTVASFLIGMNSSKEYQPISLTHAGDSEVYGDFNANGRLDNDDVEIALKIAKGELQPTQDQLLKDPNGDLVITVDDALSILKAIKQ